MTIDRRPARAPNARRRGEQLRHELVDAARESLLTTRDVTPLSLRAVAKTVGVSPAAVYRHYDSAAALVGAVLTDQADALRAAIAIHDPVELDAARMTELGLRYVRWGLANPGGYQLLFESADRLGTHEGSDGPGWDMIEALTALLAESAAPLAGGPEIVAIRAWSALHGLVSLRMHKPALPWPTSVEEEVAVLASALLGGDSTR